MMIHIPPSDVTRAIDWERYWRSADSNWRVHGIALDDVAPSRCLDRLYLYGRCLPARRCGDGKTLLPDHRDRPPHEYGHGPRPRNWTCIPVRHSKGGSHFSIEGRTENLRQLLDEYGFARWGEALLQNHSCCRRQQTDCDAVADHDRCCDFTSTKHDDIVDE